MRRNPVVFVLGLIAQTAAALAGADAASPGTSARLKVAPGEVRLVGGDAEQRLLVLEAKGDRWVDVGREARYGTLAPGVVAVSVDGLVTPRGDGVATVRVASGGATVDVPVVVEGHGVELEVSFRNQVEPILAKTGCNAGGCHGKASGQNGFKLSLLGADARFDYDAIVNEARGRRVFPARPEQSLLLRKAIAAVPHGGGRRVQDGSREYEILRRWIAQGMPEGSSAGPSLVRLECSPGVTTVDPGAKHQVIVTAHFSDGRRRDVTREAQYKSNEPDLARVDDGGLVHAGTGTGETAIMVRYLGRVDVCRFRIPQPAATGGALPWPELPRGNLVDVHVRAKWASLNLTPSPLADDATFLRRSTLDAVGTLPTPDEVRRFLDDPSPNKRAAWIDALLERREYADFWAIKWGDLLRNQRKGQREQQRGTYAFHAWIRDAFATNMPYDRFVRGVVAAQGTVDQHPPVIWYRTVRNLTHQTNDTAQLFLGTRIACAQCHNHPYEKWTQDDYYKFQSFFARVGRKSGATSQEPAIFVREAGDVRNPATGRVVSPHGLDGPEVRAGEGEDPRLGLVDWMAGPQNSFFAPALVNRLWGHFLGRGLVEPVDDLRVTNPPSNPELLDALSRDFIAHRFDNKHLIRTIMNSTTYQLSSEPVPGNQQDGQNYARAYPRRLLAEVMLDAICQVTGVPETFAGMPRGTRTIQLPDESIPSYFLDVFGRPLRETPCECERPREANLAQALQLLNSGDLQDKVGASQGRLADLLAGTKPDAEVVDELYLAAFGRHPKAAERGAILDYVAASGDRRKGFEDALWALLNTKEFLFNH